MKKLWSLVPIVMFVFFIGLIFFDNAHYHIIKLQEDGVTYYSVESCHLITPCYIFSGRYAVSPEGLAKAEADYKFFTTPEPKQKVLGVVK